MNIRHYHQPDLQMMCIIPHYRHNVTAAYEHQYSNDQLSSSDNNHNIPGEHNYVTSHAEPHLVMSPLRNSYIFYNNNSNSNICTRLYLHKQCVYVCSRDLGVELFHQAVEYKACLLNLTPAVLGLD